VVCKEGSAAGVDDTYTAADGSLNNGNVYCHQQSILVKWYFRTWLSSVVSYQLCWLTTWLKFGGEKEARQ